MFKKALIFSIIVSLVGCTKETMTKRIPFPREKDTAMSGHAPLRRQNGMIAGVCGGLGAFFGLAPFWFRLLFFLLLLPGGLPEVIPYIILWVVVPKQK